MPDRVRAGCVSSQSKTSGIRLTNIKIFSCELEKLSGQVFGSNGPDMWGGAFGSHISGGRFSQKPFKKSTKFSILTKLCSENGIFYEILYY